MRLQRKYCGPSWKPLPHPTWIEGAKPHTHAQNLPGSLPSNRKARWSTAGPFRNSGKLPCLGLVLVLSCHAMPVLAMSCRGVVRRFQCNPAFRAQQQTPSCLTFKSRAQMLRWSAAAAIPRAPHVAGSRRHLGACRERIVPADTRTLPISINDRPQRNHRERGVRLLLLRPR